MEGASIGLPGIWALLAVTVGGGIGGMLLAVPITATAYRLSKQDVAKRMGNVELCRDQGAAL